VAELGQPVVSVIHCVGFGHALHVEQGPFTYAVVVVGQQSVAHGTFVVNATMNKGHATPGSRAQDSVGHAAGDTCQLPHAHLATTRAGTSNGDAQQGC